MLLNYLLALIPNASHFVELGTFTGITSLYFGMIARLRGGKLVTFDIKDWREETVKNAWLPQSMEFILADVETVAHPRVQEEVRKTSFLFIDGGNKYREAELYAQNMQVGGIVLMHDFTYNLEGKIVDPGT